MAAEPVDATEEAADEILDSTELEALATTEAAEEAAEETASEALAA